MMEKKKIKQKNKVGKPSVLTHSMRLHIRQLILEGKERSEICEIIGIKVKTWDQWGYRNMKNFAADLSAWRDQFMVKQAIENHREFLVMPTKTQVIEDSEHGRQVIIVDDPRFLKLKSDHTIYITDTLAKDRFSKKVITEDPNAASKSEVEDLRQSYKSLISKLKPKKGIDKLKNALK